MSIYKKFSAVLLIILLILSVCVVPVSAADTYPKATITASSVNLRSGAGTSYSVLETMSKSDKVTLLNASLYNKEWYHIKTASKTKGYVHKDYLKINKSQVWVVSSKTAYTGYSFTFKNFVNTTGETAVWSSTDKNIATVSSSGKVTLKKAGNVTITITAGGKSSPCELKVVDAAVTLSETKVSLFSDDDPITLKATCKKAVTFSSSDTKIATVSSKGVVTPKAVGTAKITAESKSGKAVCTVTVAKRKVTLSVTKSTLYTGNYAIITPSGGKESYTYKSSDTGVLTVNSKGIVEAIASGTAKVTVKSGTLSATKTFTVKSGSTINLSNIKSTIYANMTLYLKSSTSGIKWKTSDKSIATVTNGYVLGKKKGYAVISAYTSSGSKDCLVTVKAAEPVRFVYASQNSVLLGNEVKLVAITDTNRGNVKFKLTNSSGNSRWVTGATKTVSSSRIKWVASTKMTKAGEYTINAYSHTKSGTTWTTSEGGRTTFFVNSSSSRTACSYSERRATTKLLKNIASFEGFLSTVTPDQLVADTPTIGYGRVVYAGSTFYNGMTKTEAFAYLVKTVNESGFTTRVNKLLIDNKIKFNQAHFDALVDFSYNLGAYAIENDDDLMNVLKNTYGKDSYKAKAYVRVPSTLLKKDASSDSDTLKTLSPNATVTLSSAKVYNDAWYKVTSSDGKTGYVKTANLVRRATDTSVRDLRNVNYNSLKSNVLPYHHASGVCYKGLLYRRIDEVELFFFRDYDVDGSSNDFGIKYYCSRNSSFGIG